MRLWHVGKKRIMTQLVHKFLEDEERGRSIITTVGIGAGAILLLVAIFGSVRVALTIQNVMIQKGPFQGLFSFFYQTYRVLQRAPIIGNLGAISINLNVRTKRKVSPAYGVHFRKRKWQCALKYLHKNKCSGVGHVNAIFNHHLFDDWGPGGRATHRQVELVRLRCSV